MKTFDGTPIAHIVNDNGDVFLMRLVRKGDGYGRGLGCIHDSEKPLVEFYDAGIQPGPDFDPGKEYGQFVSRYYAATLLEKPKEQAGINLEGSVPKWSIDANAYTLAMAILRHWLGNLSS